jgi:ubiquinone/menaquinone biosynthesis C-methylase UbiE
LLGQDYKVIRPVKLLPPDKKIAIDGAMVRREMARGDGWQTLTPKEVAEYISRYNLSPVLDICCGTGKQCYLIGKTKQQVVGLDLDLKMMSYAAFKYPDISFICADASHLPIKESCFKGIIISFALHDKKPELRTKILGQSTRLLAPGGKIILVDFERPWNRRSKIGAFFTLLIEKMAGNEHFRNGRQFLLLGGLKEFIKNEGLVEIERDDIELLSSGLVIVRAK